VLLYSTNNTEIHALTISGGWDPGCAMISGGGTTLDGQNVDQILRIFTHVADPIGVSGLTFVNGNWHEGGSAFAGGLSIRTAGEVRVEGNFFLANSTPDTGTSGGLVVGVEGGASMYVRNNLFALNGAGSTAAGRLSAEAGEQFVTNNTIIFNQATNGSASAVGGLYIADGISSHFTLSNNLAWGNDPVDLYNNSAHATTLLNNDIGDFQGQPVSGNSSSNMSADPLFGSGLFNFHPSSNSPLINAGLNAPPGGAGLVDLAGEFRVQGGRIDIGAYESDVLFYSGFDGAP
jgi:hypothetical protein